MENASHWTVSRIAASVKRVTEVPCATRRESCSTPAVVCPASTAAVRSQTPATPSVTARVATPGSSATPVGFARTRLRARSASAAATLTSAAFCPSRVRVSRRARARLLPGPERLRHLPDDAHGVLGGVLGGVRQRSLLRQPAGEASEIHLRVQRRHVLQRGGGKDHQVWLRGLHVVPLTLISCSRCQGRGRREGSKDGSERGLEESERGKEGIKSIYKTSIYILWTTMFVK